MSYKFVKNENVVYIKDISSVVIGDIHFGIEYEYRKKGIHIPNYYTNLADRLNVLIGKFSVDTLIFLGDVKHDIGDIPMFLENKIKNFFSSLKADVIHCIKGNHDGGLEKILSDVDRIRIHSSRGFSLGDYGFFHGNSWPLAKVVLSKIAFCSHLHPKLKLPSDSKKFEKDVFIVCKPNKRLLKTKYGKVELKEIVVLPPINNYVGGIEFHEWGGILKKMCDFFSSEIYSSDGHFIGSLE
ncbi:MAG: metallophosphoesterase [Candidatus Aenigmarchaeota archaeon]|nr:metallophosphoesterase [Candidatus Aenigmarchaeota archaeon]